MMIAQRFFFLFTFIFISTALANIFKAADKPVMPVEPEILESLNKNKKTKDKNASPDQGNDKVHPLPTLSLSPHPNPSVADGILPLCSSLTDHLLVKDKVPFDRIHSLPLALRHEIVESL